MSDDDEYEVGYKKPPSKTRFKKGQSGNPKGRPKNSDKKLNSMKDFVELFLAESERSVIITEQGEKQEMMMIQIAIRQVLTKAAKGNVPAVKFVTSTMTDYMRRKAIEEQLSKDRKSKKLADDLIENMTNNDLYRVCSTMYQTVRKPGVRSDSGEKIEKLTEEELNEMTEKELTDRYMRMIRDGR